MNFITAFNDIIACIYLAVIFTVLIELKYAMKTTSFLFFVYIGVALPVYFKLLSMGNSTGFSSAVAFTLPSLLLCFFLSKHRDFRFIFTFCSVDIVGFILISLSRAIGILFNDNQYIIFLLLNGGFVPALIASLKFRSRYLQIQRTINSGWKSFGVVSILFYTMMYLITSYPTPMIGRREYLPVLLVFIITVIVVYLVIYQAVMKAIKIHDEEKEKQLLETKIALQNSQLELKEIYVKMAYTDALTGLKNRTAFEEKKLALASKFEEDKPLYCLMLDLNNLKETNDIFGHDKGDELIKCFAKILNQTFDAVYRVGGDEFIALFLEKSWNQIEKQIRDLKQKVKEKNEQSSIQISFAMGLSYAKEETIKDIDALVLCADKRMYENKKNMKLSRKEKCKPIYSSNDFFKKK